jgi:hypothetical protein
MVDKMLHVFERNNHSVVWADEPILMGRQHAGNVLAIQTEFPIQQRLHQLMFWFFNSSWLSKYLTEKKVGSILLGNNTVKSVS